MSNEKTLEEHLEEDHEKRYRNTPSSRKTLRDYFAAKAMQGLLSNPEEVGMTWDKVVENSYEIADQMMEARK